MSTALETFEGIWSEQAASVPFVETVNWQVDTDELPDVWGTAVYQPETREDVTMGSAPWVEEQGQFLIGLFARSGTGPKALDDAVATLRQAFAGAARNGLFIIAVDGPHDIDPQADGEWWQVALTARFTYQSRRRQYGPLYHGWQGFEPTAWPWNDPDLVFDFDFSTERYWSASLGVITAAQAFTASRTSSGDLALDGNGLLTAFAANTPRIVPGAGLWIENSATGRLDFNDDLSNAAWVKTGMAVAQNLPSPFAVGTPAGWRITASAPNATILQTVAAIILGGGTGGSDLISSGLLYLPTGVTLAGDVQMTQDGTTWTSVKSQLVAGRWVQCVGSVEANPVTARTVGIRLTASGDSIGAMLLNIDRGYLMSSPIRVPSITTVARSSEQCRMTMANFPPMGNADMPRFTFLTVVVPVSLPLPAVLDPVHPRVGWTALEFNDDDTITANGTGSIANDVMTITAIASGAYAVGQRLLVGTGAISFTDIVSLGTGTGGTGTYNVHSSLSGTAPYPPTQTTPAGINLVSRVKDAQGYGLNSAVKENGDQQIGVTFDNELAGLHVGLDPQAATYEYNAPNAMGWSMDTLASSAHVALKGDVYTSTDAQLPASPQLGAGCYVMIGGQGGGTGPIGALRGVVARTLCIGRALSAAEISEATIALQSAA